MFVIGCRLVVDEGWCKGVERRVVDSTIETNVWMDGRLQRIDNKQEKRRRAR